MSGGNVEILFAAILGASIIGGFVFLMAGQEAQMQRTKCPPGTAAFYSSQSGIFCALKPIGEK